MKFLSLAVLLLCSAANADFLPNTLHVLRCNDAESGMKVMIDYVPAQNAHVASLYARTSGSVSPRIDNFSRLKQAAVVLKQKSTTDIWMGEGFELTVAKETFAPVGNNYSFPAEVQAVWRGQLVKHEVGCLYSQN